MIHFFKSSKTNILSIIAFIMFIELSNAIRTVTTHSQYRFDYKSILQNIDYIKQNVIDRYLHYNYVLEKHQVIQKV